MFRWFGLLDVLPRMWKHAGMCPSDAVDRWFTRQCPQTALGGAALQHVLRGRLSGFVEDARTLCIRPRVLETFDGRRTYRSAKCGWVLFPATGLAVGTDAELYQLVVRRGLFASKAPVREELIHGTYRHGWLSAQVTLDEMLVDALLRGISNDTA